MWRPSSATEPTDYHPPFDVVDRLMAQCPELTVLATSRERLSLPGETVWPVEGLTLGARARALPAANKADADGQPRASPTVACACWVDNLFVS